MTANTEQLATAVRTAREAVSDLDEPLKTEAFKILLERLLSDGSGGATKKGSVSRARANSPATKTKSRGSRQDPRTPRPTSSLRLDVNALKKLKSYCGRFELQGSEQIAFILANFAREHTDLEAVTAADVEYLYRQLVSQRVKVVAINDSADWARALSWLTAPSRRKEWLTRAGDGYAVSNSGLLRFHELEEAAAQKGGSDSAS